MKNIDTTMRIRLWFETDSQMLFGLGRVLLLKQVDECGSLYKAAKEMGMSYRAAWGKIKATENELGVELLTKAPGEKRYRLSENGRLLLDRFDLWCRDIEELALQKARNIFPWQIRKFDAKEINNTP